MSHGCNAGASKSRHHLLAEDVLAVHSEYRAKKTWAFGARRMTKLSAASGGVDADSIGKVCELLEGLGEVFAQENVDYAYGGGANRFFVCYCDLWYAVTFSDTTLLIRTVADLHWEICRAVYSRLRPADNPFGLD